MLIRSSLKIDLEEETVEDKIMESNNMNNNIIKVENLTKVYKVGEIEVHAIRGVSLEVKKGEFVAIMGASGSGKSTFMNILGCLDVPTSGSYTLEGTQISQLTRDQLARIRNNKIGFVFQGFNLLSRTTAVENVELPLYYKRTGTKERRELAMEALESVGLADRAHHTPNQLSGGQQQRVAIARALATNPSLILADEPTGNLDSRTSIEIMEIFQKLNENDITIVLVTHEKDIAEFAKRNVHFRDGKIGSDIIVNPRKIASKVLELLPVNVEEEIV